MDSGNFRPVMQSSTLLKIIELHVLSYLEEKISFDIRQFGFKNGCSTTDACLMLKETVNKYIKRKGRAYATFIDLSKAFDRVNHFMLGQQLLDRGTPPDLVLLIMRYLRNQSARVCWNGHKGHYVFLERGVRQGGILSPFLFKLYIDHLLTQIANANIGCKLGILRINVIAYADDIVLLADSMDNISKLYKLLKDGLQKLQLNMNKTKSKCMVFQKSGVINETSIKLDSDTLDIVTNYKYLGHMVNSQLLDTADIRNQLNSFYAKFNCIFRNFNNVSVETFMLLFNSYCLPDYGLAIWNISNIIGSHVFKSFETGFSNSLKKIIGVPLYSSSHITAEICGSLLFIHHLSIIQARYMKRLANVNNSIINLSFYYLQSGFLFNSVFNHFKDKYNVNVWSNDLDTLKARVSYVQKHEERSRTCYFYGI